uniref:Transient receptor potential cation channel subfamily M member 1-like n=1 Tax=Saccoglossus kowalevskii TaxID=10224 RepID=A0ABM0GQ80_SACKO|nr:PREDICTED: transient receptor potential cation channel subfamily M member 1-like [Saccoglossus kowalevskii]
MTSTADRYGETSLEMTEQLMNNRECDVSDTDVTDTESGDDGVLIRELKPMLNDVTQNGASEQNRRKRIANFIYQNGIQQKAENHGTRNTQSFGDIEFVGFGQNIKKSPYIRVDNNTEPTLIWDLLINQWKMDKPKVLISVTGGAHDYHFKSRLKTLFKEGLIKAAVSTGAWIITRGIDAGVSKIVGEAIKEEHTEIMALGMAGWDSIDNNAALHGHTSDGKWPAKYGASELSHDKPALDCNHTHFILMDHGREELGYQLDVRDNLEQYISELPVKDGEEINHIPVVLVVIGGATKTIAKVYKSLMPEDGQAIPVVVVDGSGRAADLVAKALRITEDEPDEQIRDIIKDELAEDIRKVLLKPDTALNISAVNKCIDTLAEIVNSQNRSMMTVFDMHTSFIKDIDRTILCGLLKAKHVREDIKSQLHLAMRLNRCDIAETEIITADRRTEWKNLHFEEHMETALIQNKVDFVTLFLEHVIQLETFLTIARLHALYTKIIKARYAIAGRLSTKHILKRLLKGKEDKVYLQAIGRLCQEFLEDEFDVLYQDDKYVVDDSIVTSHVSRSKKIDFQHSDKDLLIWAVLTNRRGMAELFWRRLTIGNIGSALIAARILTALAKKANIEESTLTHDLENHADAFVKFAIGVIDQCYEDNKRWAQLTLVRKLSVWGNTTCLSIAYSGQKMNFLEHECCQTKMERTWKGMIQMNLFEQKAKVAYIVMLLMFSWFLLTDLRPSGLPNSPGVIEYVVMIWISTLIIEELRQLRDLLHFVVILVIFLLSFGYATQALLTPNQDPHISVLWTSLYRPHWQLYGWLFLDEIEDQVTNETCYYNGEQVNGTFNGTAMCVDTQMYGWVIPLLIAIYLMIANILLINLLIAMFSYTFQNVQDNSMTIWRFFRCQVIAEYFERPTLAPPFIILSHVYRLVKFAYQKMRLRYNLKYPGNRTNQEIRNENDKRQSHALNVCLDEKEEHYINSFEKRCMEKYFSKLRQEDIQSIENTVSSNADRLEEVKQQVEELKEAIEDIPMATELPSNSSTISTQNERTDTEEKLLQFMSQLNERMAKLEENIGHSHRLV